MAVVGAIADRVRGILPLTWDALSKDSRYGDGLLRETIDTVKETVTGTNVLPAAEVSYPKIVVDYLAKVVALELISPGIDFWMNQPVSETATGVSEADAFVDRADKLIAQRKELLEETRRLWPLVSDLIGYSRITSGPVPLINTLDEPFLTPSPLEFQRPFKVTTRS